MEGGINAWRGLVAEGIPEAGMVYFASADRPEDLVALASQLEEGNRRFYADIAGSLDDKEAAGLFEGLAAAEEHHKSSLLKVYSDITGMTAVSEIPDALAPGQPDDDIMEGGMSVSKALKWAEDKSLTEILELSISLETNAYDLYIKMERKAEDGNSKRVFKTLSEEEGSHLNRLSALLEERLL
jgi:rubrerythrin